MTTVFKPNGNFAKTFYTPGGEVGRWLRKEGKRVEHVSKTLVGVDSGRLRRSIKASKVTKAGVTDLEVEVTADARKRGSPNSYAYIHHEGSRPHVISAPPGGALHWGGARGPTVVIVNHPGTGGTKYLIRALNIVVGGMRAL